MSNGKKSVNLSLSISLNRTGIEIKAIIVTNIVTLKKATKESVHLVGKKAVTLAILSQKYPVPSAFIITAAVFDQFLITNQIKKQAKEMLEQLKEDDEIKYKKQATL